MIKFIHMGDIHLGRYFNYPALISVARREELWRAFEDVCARGTADGIDFIFLSGDIYEMENFRLSDYERLKSIFQRHPSIKFMIISGNHDHLKSKGIDIRYVDLENVYIFKDELSYFEFDDLQTRVYGYSWTGEVHPQTLELDVKLDSSYSNILLLHCEVDTPGDYLPMKSSYLKTLDFDYIALGHIHMPIQYSERIRYSGSLEPLSFGELGSRGYVSGTIDGHMTESEFVEHGMRVYHRLAIEVQGSDDYHSLETKLMTAAKANGEVHRDFYSIVFTGFRSEGIHIDELMDRLSSDFYYFKYEDETLLEYDLEMIYAENRDNIIGQFIMEMSRKGLEDEKNREILYCGLEALFSRRV